MVLVSVNSIVITHRRHRETWQQREDRIAVSKRIDAERKKDADKSGIGIKITGIAPSLFTVGNKISSYQLSKTALNAMAIIGMIGRIDDSRTMIDGLMS